LALPRLLLPLLLVLLLLLLPVVDGWHVWLGYRGVGGCSTSSTTWHADLFRCFITSS
jgi:hypothetical protein